MASPSTHPAPRFHRRILALGALATLLLLVIGAPFFKNRIEDDLERRVPVELAAVGFGGITATFSGQDGTLRCAAPLDDPEQAIAAAYDVWGVRAIEIDRSCRVNSAPTVETTTTLAVDLSATEGTAQNDPGDTGDPGDTVDVDATSDVGVETTIPPDFDSVADIVTTSPQLSLLAVLTEEAGMNDIFGPQATESVTLFAPTDDAFDALEADALAQLRADPDLLRQVLSHHVTSGALRVSDLIDGPLATLDGGTVEISSSGAQVTVSGASALSVDIVAANGIVHVIDQVLVPADVDLSVPGPFAETSAVFDDGRVTLSGVVASEVERAVLTAAVASAPGSLVVDDQLTIDPDSGIGAVTVGSLARLVAAMPVNLLNGVSGFDGNMLYVTGTYRTEADRDAMSALATEVAAAIELQPQPDATDSDAVDLEAALNAYVAANPILFQPSSSELADSSLAVLDRLALEALQFSGVSITVQGHTDSDGIPAQNLVLSRFRALAVRQALIDRGLPEASITAEGFGSEQPILVDGVEDKPASRRVEFRVVATP